MYNRIQRIKCKRWIINCYTLLFVSFFFVFSLISTVYAHSINYSPLSPNENFTLTEPISSEHIDLIAGVNNSILVSLTLNGGEFNISKNFSNTLKYFSRFELIISNQSCYSQIWTNPLMPIPDGLNLRIELPTRNKKAILETILPVINYIEQHYNVKLLLSRIKTIGSSSTEVLLSGVVESKVTIKEIFELTFYPYLHQNSIYRSLYELLFSSKIYGFGFSLVKRNDGEVILSRKIVLGLLNAIIETNNNYYFSWSRIFGNVINPSRAAISSSVRFIFPFLIKILNVQPFPDNKGAEISGYLEWLLKYNYYVYRSNLDIKLNFTLIDEYNLTFPRVTVSSYYSDALLNNNGTLRINYKVRNTGTAPAINTTIIFPIPDVLYDIINSNTKVYVLKDNITGIDEFSSNIYLHISYYATDIYIPLLFIKGWYQNLSTYSLARWENLTNITLNELVSIESTAGLPSDLYYEISQRVFPYIDEYDINELRFNSTLRDYFFEQLKLNLTLSITSAYNTTFNAFYTPKKLFIYDSSDFYFKETIMGKFLIAKIPYLEINETQTLSWALNNIPTEKDRFSAFSFHILKTSSGTDYILFNTRSTDYKQLIKLVLALKKNSGRFLSVQNEDNTFVSLGSRFVFFDENGKDYYGITNGLNLQLGDDEAVLESLLRIDKPYYTIGDKIALNLSIFNYGTIGAYNVSISILSIKLDTTWQPQSVVPIKSLYVEQIPSNTLFTKIINIRANGYVGFNGFVAIISFTSDKGQTAEVLVNPWTNDTTIWKYAEETQNIVVSTLAFGVALPPHNLIKKLRPAIPVPEIETQINYDVNKEQKNLKIEYQIKNVGLSVTNVSCSKFYNSTNYYVSNISVTYYPKDGQPQQLSIEIITEQDYMILRIENVTLHPGDKIIIIEEHSNINSTISVPPLIVSYTSQYLIYHNDFENTSNETNDKYKIAFYCSEEKTKNNILSFGFGDELTESEQESFAWTIFSSLLELDFSKSISIPVPTLTRVSYYYPLITLAVLTFAVIVIVAISRKK